MLDGVWSLPISSCVDNVPSDVLSRAPISDEETLTPVFVLTRGQLNRSDIVQKTHDLYHFSAERTLQLAKQVDASITLSEVKEYVSRCKVCLEGPHAVPKAPIGITRTATIPWEIVHCDFVGPIPKTASGFEYIFTYKDDLTRFVIAWPIRSATTAIAISVIDRLFSIFGPPRILHSDNGSVFTSRDLVTAVQKWNTEC